MHEAEPAASRPSSEGKSRRRSSSYETRLPGDVLLDRKAEQQQRGRPRPAAHCQEVIEIDEKHGLQLDKRRRALRDPQQCQDQEDQVAYVD